MIEIDLKSLNKFKLFYRYTYILTLPLFNYQLMIDDRFYLYMYLQSITQKITVGMIDKKTLLILLLPNKKISFLNFLYNIDLAVCI